MPIHIYWGEEDFNIELAVKKLRKKVLDPDWKDFNHKTLDNPSLQEIIESISTLPMGFGDLLVEVHNTSLFSKGQQKTDEKLYKAQITEFLDVAQSLNDRVNLLFVVRFPKGSKKKIDRTLKVTKELEKIAIVRQFDSFKPWNDKEVISFINEYASDKKVCINPDAAYKMFELIGPDLRTLNSELTKLATYVGEGNLITNKEVNLLCAGTDNVFYLADYWVQHKTNEAMAELKKILDKDHPIKILAVLQTLVGEWLHIKLELKHGKRSTALAKEIGMHEFRLKKTIEKLQRVPVERLSKMKNEITMTEMKIKTGQLQAELGIELLITT